MELFLAVCLALFSMFGSAGSAGIDMRVTTSYCTGTPADVVFVLDSSNSIWLPDFKRELTFVKEVISSFDVGMGDNQTRVGLMTFGHEVWPQFYLDTYADADEMLSVVERVSHGRGIVTNTGDAIKFMRDVMLTSRAGGRENVTRIGIVFTDGRSQKTWMTQEHAKDAHTDGIKIFTISVGFRQDPEELKGIASDPDDEYLFSIDDFQAFDSIKDEVSNAKCQASSFVAQTFMARPTPIPTSTELPADVGEMNGCDGKRADIFILIDSSSSIEQEDFDKELEFVQGFINVLDIGHNKTKLGILTFSDDVKFNVRLNFEMTKEQYSMHLHAISYMGQGTDTAKALRRMREDGFDSGSSRPDVSHIAVVLTDGYSRDPVQTAKEAEFAHMKGIQVFSVGIGDGIDKLELTDMASNPDEDFVFHVGSFDKLESIKMRLASAVCSLDPVLSYVSPNDEAGCSPRKATDLLFIYDAYNLGSWKTQSISQFIADSLSEFDLRSDLLRVGREIQNCPDGNIPLGSVMNQADMASVKYFTLTDMLKRIRRNSFTVENGARNPGEEIVVLFLDQDQVINYETFQEAKLLKSSVDVFYVVIIGNHSRAQFFADLAGEGYFLQISSYDHLPSLTTSLKNDLCEFLSSVV